VKLYRQLYKFVKYVDEHNDSLYDADIEDFNAEGWQNEDPQDFITVEDAIDNYVKDEDMGKVQVRKLLKYSLRQKYLEAPIIREKRRLVVTFEGASLLQKIKFFKYGMWLEVTKHLAIYMSVVAMVVSLIGLFIALRR
jgi:hypothetical protein